MYHGLQFQNQFQFLETSTESVREVVGVGVGEYCTTYANCHHSNAARR